MILNQLQIFTEHSQTKRVSMRVNTSILEAQGARLIKNKCQANLLTRGCLVSQQLSHHWKCLIPSPHNLKWKKNRGILSRQISKGGGKSPRWTMFWSKVRAVGEGVVYLPLKVFLKDLLESAKAPALGLASTSVVMLTNASAVQKGSRRPGRKGSSLKPPSQRSQWPCGLRLRCLKKKSAKL